MSTYLDFGDKPLAFPPSAAPAYLTLGRLLTLLGKGDDGRPLMNRQSVEMIALSGAIDVLIARERQMEVPSWDAVVADDNGRLLVDAAAVDILRNLQWVAASSITEPVFNVRVLPGRVDDSAPEVRQFLGWHARMSSRDAYLAVTRWWQRPREDMTSRPFIATIAGLCVYVGRITSVSNRLGLAEFEVDTKETALTDTWLYRRVRTPPGGNTAILRPTE